MKKSTVIKIPEGYNFKPIPGFDRYLMDTEKMVVFNKCYNRIFSVGNREKFQLRLSDYDRRTISINRLVYATEKQIDYFAIPHQFIVHNEDGKMVVFEKRDTTLWALEKRIKKSTTDRIAIIDEKMRELMICRNCYETGDISEAMLFIEEHQTEIMLRFKRNFKTSKENCYIAFAEAFDIMADKMKQPHTLVTNLTSTVFQIMSKQHRKHRKHLELKE